jgi:hypothetical protein
MLDGFCKADPPPTKQLPVDADVAEYLVNLGQKETDIHQGAYPRRWQSHHNCILLPAPDWRVSVFFLAEHFST